MLCRVMRLSLLAFVVACLGCGSRDEPAASPTPSPTPVVTAGCPQAALIDIPIAQAPGEQSHPKVALARDGTTWVAWYSQEDGNWNLRVQRLGRDGNPTLDAAGLWVGVQRLRTAPPDFSLAVDADGAAIVAASDERSGILAPCAYKIAPDGAMAWGWSGVPLGYQIAPGSFPRMALLPDGAAVFAWEEPLEVRVRRVSADGRSAWGPLSVRRVHTPWVNWAWLAASDAGAVVLVWAEASSPGAASPMVYARKLDVGGQAAWPADVVVAGSQINPYYDRPTLEPDGAGGVFVAWPMVLPEYSRVRRVMQHLGADGRSSMAIGGERVSLSDATSQLEPSLSYRSDAGELVIAWSDSDPVPRKNGVRAQRMTSDGTRRWGDLGVELVPPTPFIPDIPSLAGVRATTAGAVVVYTEQISVQSLARRVLGGRLTLADVPTWSPVTLSRLTSEKSLPALGGTRECGVWAVWQDKNADGGDIRGSFLPLR